MTEERAEKLIRYARKVWCRDMRYRDEPVEDFVQTFILFALENPEDTPAFILWKMSKRELHKNPYRLKYFSEIESDERYKNGAKYLESLLRVEEEKCKLEGEDSIDDLAEILYDERKDLRELFLDYLYGQSCIDTRFVYRCRQKLFRRRFEILDYLLRLSKIAEREKERLEEIARDMQRVAPLRRRLSLDIKAREKWKRYSEKNREKERERSRQNQKKRRQARQAQRANSAKEI